ncbi:MAG: C4-dicarboxylate ABC transporter substrate-binding protein [Acidobacteria bacterium]|nr:C4-dicarboxylate ABC transporter substrate-binding protein [Acidobacteriota bacterium]
MNTSTVQKSKTGVLRAISRACAVACLAAAPAFASAETLRMASPYPETNFHTANIHYFIDALEQDSDGRLNVKLFANSSIFKAPEILPAVGGKLVDLGEIFLAAYANEDPLFGADAVSYLISGYDGAERLDAATRSVLEDHLAAKGVKLLYTVPWPPAGLYTTREINAVADLNGMKIRSASPITKEWTDKFGMQSVVIQVPELAQAFATGVVDSMFTASALAPSIQAWEFTKYFYDIQAVLTRNAVVMNLEEFNALSPEDKTAVLDAAAKAQEAGWAASRQADLANKKLMEEHGMQIVTPSPELEQAMRAAAREVIANWMITLPDDEKAVLVEFAQ